MNHTATLRISLLVAMGLVPLACSGTSRDSEQGGPGGTKSGGSGGGGSGGGAAGTRASGGSTGGGGTSNLGGAGPAGSAGESGSDQGGSLGVGGGAACKEGSVDPVSGLACDGAAWHRPQAVDCGQSQGGEGGGGGEGGSSELPRAAGQYCLRDADCAEFEAGYCAGAVLGQLSCRSGCYTDNDCGEGAICICGSDASPTGGECHPAGCATDADCPGSLCAQYDVPCRVSEFACLTEADACVSDSQCVAGFGCTITSSEAEGRTCEKKPTCGRPFLVEAAARLPPVVSRLDWCDELSPRVDHLTPRERAALAEHWTKLGQMEHASIAAFARFNLQLLALGAPPHLVEACTRALADETAHARLCFGIASAYAGCGVGPGPLDVSNSLELTSLVDIVDLVILEGCIGETVAALDALESAQEAADPVIRAAYSRIAADEQRHAELAFRFVQWALEREPEGVLERLEAALTTLPPSRALTDVVAPCLRALTHRAVAA